MTYHSIERTRERVNIPKSAVPDFLMRARTKGKSKEYMPTAERDYMESKESGTSYLIYYSGYLFVFCNEDICITVYHAPSWFLKKYNFDGKTKVRKPRKYYRLKGENLL